MRSNLIVPLLLMVAAAGACSRPTAPYGRVAIPLTETDAAGIPQRLHGEFTFSSVDHAAVESASTETAGAADVLEVQLPAGRYHLTLNDEFVVESSAPRTAATRARNAWVNPVRPPLVGVSAGQVTRVHFDLVATDPSMRRRARSPGAEASRREAAPHADRMKQLSRASAGPNGE